MQRNQYLVSSRPSPISADPAVWIRPKEIESLAEGNLPDFYNPFYLTKDPDVLPDICLRQGITIDGLWPVCITIDETNVIALMKRYGPGYFDNRTDEESVLSQGWRFMGFDVVDLDGLISGLNGCGYVEPAWSLLRKTFAMSLNEIGLFNNLSVAHRFAEVRGLQIRDHAPFVVVGVLIFDPI